MKKSNYHLDKCFECMVVNLVHKSSLVYNIEIICKFGEMETIVEIKVTPD